MADVYYDAFISYSTQDTEFVTKIRLMLELSGRRVWQDIKDIELTARWWEEIKAGIAASDNFLFVVSPRAMASPICHLELEHARQLNKRVIIIRYEDAVPDSSTKAMVERILTQHYLKTVTSGRDMFGVAEENWRTIEAEQNISVTGESEMLSKVPKLIEAFDKDLLHIRQGNILLGRATEWQESGQNPSFLLVGEALKAAEAWRDVGKRPAPTADHLAYITASRKEEDRRRRELRNLRLGRLSFAAVGTLAAIIALASLLSLNDTQQRADEANGQAATATRQVATAAAVQSIAESNAAIANTQVAFAEATVTQAAINEQIVIEFSSILLNLSQNPSRQINAMNILIRRYPNEAEAYDSRGIVHAQQGNFSLAIDDFTKAILLKPSYADPYNNRGFAHYNSGNYLRAISDYTEAIRLDPNLVTAYVGRGIVRSELGQLNNAIEDYSKAINLDPNYAFAYIGRGIARENLGNLIDAIQDYTEAIRIDADYAIAYNNRGNAHYSFGNIRGAIADYSEAIRLNENYANAYRGRGNAYYSLNRYAEAAADYRRYEAITGQLEPFMVERLAQIEAELGGTSTPAP